MSKIVFVTIFSTHNKMAPRNSNPNLNTLIQLLEEVRCLILEMREILSKGEARWDNRLRKQRVRGYKTTQTGQILASSHSPSRKHPNSDFGKIASPDKDHTE